ncbi:Oligouridylate-binding protein 1B [Forsythia ovata]|uniref:Oligouridylate-binding protein 1B n=1 Tax=Forsythia ovata TaxID=205694 RepID=A0ABD1PFS6_9LAMI
MQNQRLKQQQLALMQQALLQQQSLYHLGLLAAPEIEPIPSGNLPPGFDPSTCRNVYVGNIHAEVTETLLQEVFASTGPVKSCKLIRKENSIKVSWACASGQREDTSSGDERFMWDKKTGHSRGYGFVSFRNEQDAQSAINDLTAPGPLPGISATDLLAYERQLALSKMSGVHALMQPHGQHPLKQASMGMAAGASQAIYYGSFQNVAAAQHLMYYYQ